MPMGVVTQKQTLRAAAHSRSVICVSLRTAASAEAPAPLMPLNERLVEACGARDGERAAMSKGAGTKGVLWGGGGPQGGNLRLLEAGSERGGALVSDIVQIDTANKGQSVDGG